MEHDDSPTLWGRWSRSWKAGSVRTDRQASVSAQWVMRYRRARDNSARAAVAISGCDTGVVGRLFVEPTGSRSVRTPAAAGLRVTILAGHSHPRWDR